MLLLLAGFAAAFVAGAINAIAGGGTLVSFPAIVALGVPSLTANATNAVALWPGSLASAWAYRRQLEGAHTWAVRFVVPSILGALAGASLLLVTSERLFDRIVPYLVLAATVLFMLQPVVSRRLRLAPRGPDDEGPPRAGAMGAQFLVAIYGGYFGAGIGIMMLAVLGTTGITNIHRMNGLKNWGAVCINAVAALLFAVSGIVHWPLAASMAAGGMLGGYVGAHGAQRLPDRWVRRVIAGVGLGAFVWLLLRDL